MGRKPVPMSMGMGIVPWSEHRFCLRVVGRVRMQVIHRVMVGIIFVAFLVLAGM
jgi:hypothetical protein